MVDDEEKDKQAADRRGVGKRRRRSATATVGSPRPLSPRPRPPPLASASSRSSSQSNSAMEALKAEIALKRKSVNNDTSRPAKYMRRGDVEKMKEEQERKEREEKETKEREEATRKELEREAAKAKVSNAVPSHPTQFSSFTMENRLVHLPLRIRHSPTACAIRAPRISPPQPLPSISLTKRPFVGCAQRGNPFVCLANQTRTVDCVCVHWS